MNQVLLSMYRAVWRVFIWLTNARLQSPQILHWYKLRISPPSENATSTVLFHCASLGEYERIKTIADHVALNTKYQVEISFFSPSGFERVAQDKKSNFSFSYSPLDTPKFVKQYLLTKKVKAAVISTNEVWP
ncbi:MAG: glycosyltransferase N-terminal domain-containing protein, partial [Bacteroidota bacterium]